MSSKVSPRQLAPSVQTVDRAIMDLSRTVQCECSEPGETCSPCEYLGELSHILEDLRKGRITPSEAASEAGVRV